MDGTPFETLTHIGDGLASSTNATGDTRTRASNNSETLSMQMRTDRTPLPVTPEAGEPTVSIAKRAALLSPANSRVPMPLKRLVADLPSCAERCEVVLPEVDSMHLNSRGGVLPSREAVCIPQRELHRNPIKEGQRCVVHPQGFRILKDTSVMERSMRGYFRLPPAPNRRLREERNHLHRKLLRIERGELAELNNTTGGVGMVLDGFLLLSAAAVENPDEVEAVTLQDSHLTGAVVEDLSYFTNLFFLDVSENAVSMEELLPLTGLETLHMACNEIRSLRGLEKAIQWQVAQSSDQFRPFTGDSNANMGSTRSSALHDVLLPNLIALNLSYNIIPSHHLTLLSHFPCLEKLDLSGNYLKELPADLSLLTSVTHLALEGNLFVSKNRRSNGVDVFDSLATMPSLIEVNLNHNKLSRVPVMSVQDGRGLCFPSIEVIGLSDNHFRTTEDVLPLACLHRTLRRVVLSNNPICSNPRNFKRCRLQFEQTIIEAYYDRTTKDMMSPRSCAEAEESQKHSLKLQEEGDMWKEETWSRLIPQDFEALCNTGHHILDVSVAAAAAAAAVAAEGNGRDLSHGEYDAPHFDSSAERSALPTEKGEFFDSHERQDGANSGFLKTGHSSIKDYFATAEAYLSANNVDIVFQDADMPKRPLRYFYRMQTRVGGQSNLVTVPRHGEFMDIYGIVGRRKCSALFECKRRREERKRRVYVPPVLSSSSESDDAETVGAEEEAKIEPVVPSTGGDSGTFFITETEVCGKVAKGRPRPKGDDPVPESQQWRSPSSNPTRRSKSRKAVAPSLLKPPVVSPVNVNVHGAINELKALLRKPLPPLPYGKTYSMSKS